MANGVVRMINRQNGQSTVEFAFVVPTLIFLFLSILYIGIMFCDYIQFSNAARDAARDISLQVGTLESAATARKDMATRIKAQDKALLDRYAVQLTNLYSPTWDVVFLKGDGSTAEAKDAVDVQVNITLTRDDLPSALEALHILPRTLKTISYKMNLERTMVITKTEGS